MIIYLAPTLLVVSLVAAATRLRRHIEPACPSCARRSWNDTPTGMACIGCGWSTTPQVAATLERQAA